MEEQRRRRKRKEVKQKEKKREEKRKEKNGDGKPKNVFLPTYTNRANNESRKNVFDHPSKGKQNALQ